MVNAFWGYIQWCGVVTILKLNTWRVLQGLFVPLLTLSSYIFLEYIFKVDNSFEVYVIVLTVGFLPHIILFISYLLNDWGLVIKYDRELLVIERGGKKRSYKLSEVGDLMVVESWAYRIFSGSYVIISFQDGHQEKVSYLLAESLELNGVPKEIGYTFFPII